MRTTRTLRRNVGIGGLTYRPLKKISFSAEGEAASSGGAYFRTSLYNYQKVRAQARYQATGQLSFSADFSLLDNQDPQPGINYDYLALSGVDLGIVVAPRWQDLRLTGELLARRTVRSDIDYLDPGTLQPQPSTLSRKFARGDGAASLFVALSPARLRHNSSRAVRC